MPTSPFPRRRTLLRHALAWPLATLALGACGQARTGDKGAGALPANTRVLAIGDSLTAGQGAPRDQAWPAVLARLTGWQIDNAGRNGDTSAGALQRLPGLLAAARYDAVLIGIGGNDMIRSVPRETTVDNIRQMLRLAAAQTRHVALLATPLPDIWRASLGHLQDATFYAELARDEQALLPGIYAGVLNQPALRADQIHANAQGYDAIARQLRDALAQAGWLRAMPAPP
ncbi:MAG: Arylesterase [Paracidovorax wautersii]|uniref:Arylesterase n=1 Tax=Paracidovorax wautersii TaxID=1177982 RepID=A0A7V8FSC8_9BURK|nr:MAG: Arylesterase [Paracidovorax wautersii]